MTPLSRCAASPQGDSAGGRAKPVPRRSGEACSAALGKGLLRSPESVFGRWRLMGQRKQLWF